MEDDTRFLILHGCKLAKDLESNLLSLLSSDQRALIRANARTTCEEIIRVFRAVADKLMIKSAEYDTADGRKKRCFALEGGIDGREVVRADMAVDANLCKDVGVRHHHQQRRRSRRGGRHEAEKTIMRVPAPQFGDTSVPMADGHTWRKYGQKIILGSKFPRSYYRCTHLKLYQCPAKKLVQRLDHDPSTFEVTYQGSHTCLMSATAPLLPQPALDLGQVTRTYADNDRPSSHNRVSESTNNTPTASLLLDLCSGGVCAGPSTSTARRDGEVAKYPVASMANAMFNSGGFGANSMDLIFASKEEKLGALQKSTDHM